VKDTIKNNWITQGIKISNKRMLLLDNQRKTTVMEEKDLEYVENYRKIYKKVIKEAKKKENDGYINNASNKSKGAWQIINKELGKSFISSKNVKLNWGNN
jgi:hypothetical protein